MPEQRDPHQSQGPARSSSASPTGLYLGFDHGGRRIGVAVGDGITATARGLATVAQDWAAIGRLIREWQPTACIVGLPLGADGAEQAASRRARQFAAELTQRFGVRVHLCDEGYSSLAAMDELRQARASGRLKRRVREGDEDQQAARLVLEQWLAEQRGAASRAATTEEKKT